MLDPVAAIYAFNWLALIMLIVTVYFAIFFMIFAVIFWGIARVFSPIFKMLTYGPDY